MALPGACRQRGLRRRLKRCGLRRHRLDRRDLAGLLDDTDREDAAGSAEVREPDADPDASFTKAIGMDFDAPPAGLFGRSKRFAMLVDNGVVSVLHDGDKPGECTVASGETLLDSM